MVANKSKATKRKANAPGPDPNNAQEKPAATNGRSSAKQPENDSDQSASDYYESDEENLLANINNEEGDSSDSDGEGDDGSDNEVRGLNIESDSDFEEDAAEEAEEEDADGEEEEDSADDVNSDSSPEEEEEEDSEEDDDEDLEFEEDLAEPEKPKAIKEGSKKGKKTNKDSRR